MQDLSPILLSLFGIFGLVFANGFFVAAEFSLITVRKTRIDQLIAEGNRTARVVRRAMADPNSYIASTQLGITMASLGLGWIGEPALAAMFEPPLRVVGGEPMAWFSAHSIAVFFGFVVITALHIVLGELAPKTVALQYAERTSLLVVPPTHLFMRLCWPFIRLLNGTGRAVVRSFGLRAPSGHSLVHSEEELKMLVTASQEAGVIEEEEEQMLHRVFGFADLTAGQVMVPRTEMVAIPATATLETLVDLIVSSGHDRLPVYGDDLDDVVGVLQLSDVLPVVARGSPLDIVALAHEAMTVPETVTADTLLSDMRRKRTSLAIVIDEYRRHGRPRDLRRPHGTHRRRDRRRRRYADSDARRWIGTGGRACPRDRCERAVRPAHRRGCVQHAWRVRPGPAGTAAACRRPDRSGTPVDARGRAGWSAGRARVHLTREAAPGRRARFRAGRTRRLSLVGREVMLPVHECASPAGAATTCAADGDRWR